MKKKSMLFLVLLATIMFLMVGCNNGTQMDNNPDLDEYGLTAEERIALSGENLDEVLNPKSRELKPTNPQSAYRLMYEFLMGKKSYTRSISANGISGKYIAMKGEGGDDTPEHYTTSEATGYGMRLAAYSWKTIRPTSASAGRFRQKFKVIFDDLWKLQHSFPSTTTLFDKNNKLVKVKGLHSWVIPKTMKPSDGTSSAADGELDMAYALLQAHKLWGSNGSINYRAEAKKIIDGIATYLTKKATVYNREITYLAVGDWVHWVEKKGAHLHSRPCDWSLHHFRTFIRFLEAEGQGHSSTANTFRELLSDAEYLISLNKWGSGLMPDFVYFGNGKMDLLTPEFEVLMGEDVAAEHYSWNSCRIPWRLAMDLIQEGRQNANVARVTLRDIYSSTLAGKSVAQTGSEYYLDGIIAHSAFESAFASPIAASMLGRMCYVGSAGEGQFLSRKKKQQMDIISSQFSGDPLWGYFGDAITAFCMLIMENDERVISSPY